MSQTLSTKTSKSEPANESRRTADERTPQSLFGLETQVLHLQSSIGKRAVGQLLSGLQSGTVNNGSHVPGASPIPQTITPYTGTSLQRKCAACEEEVPRAESANEEPEAEEGKHEVAVDEDMPKPGQPSGEEEEEQSLESPAPDELLQRKSAGCKEEATLQTKEAPTGQVVANNSVVHDFNGGQPLNDSTRRFFEPRFGYSFDQVRVHTDRRAAESTRAVNALAYTRGHDIVFAPGRYAPETAAGRRLLAHELTHVMQQNPSHLAQSKLSQSSNRIQTAIAIPNMVQRWHTDGATPADTNTIVCDGKGNVRVQLGGTGNADQTACLSDCMRRHEESHRADALAAKPKVCEGQTDGTQVTFNGEQKASERKASNVEIACLKGKQKTASAKCKPIIKDRIKQMQDYRDSFK